MAFLLVVDKFGQNIEFPLDKEKIHIGRSIDNDLVFPEDVVSRKHALVKSEQDHFIIEDLNSHNGVYVNGTKIKKKVLTHKDKIRIGVHWITFFDDSIETGESKTIFVSTNDHLEEENSSIIRNVEDIPSLLPEDAFIKKEVKPSIEEKGYKDALPSILPQESYSYEERDKLLFLLYEISTRLIGIEDVDEIFPIIMDLIFKVIDADLGLIIMIEPEKNDLVTKALKTKKPRDKGKKIKVSRTIINRIIQDKVAILSNETMSDSRFSKGKSIFLENIQSTICAPLWNHKDVIGVIQLISNSMKNQFTSRQLNLLTIIANQLAIVIEKAQLTEKIRQEKLLRDRLERYHSPDVIQLIMHGSEEAYLAPREQIVTILFADIVGFTEMSERLSPTRIGELLNEYFSVMSDIIFDNHGTLDKYIGDAIMAVFGAPFPGEDDPIRAIKVALRMQQRLKEMNEKRGEDGFDMRIGINTGKVVVGNIGSMKRMEYTVLGDPVNIASRLETIAKPNQILIGEETYRAIADSDIFNIKPLGKRKIKGRHKELMVYEVLSIR
ncbi:MAG: FHA domain-containing protein [Deltaproteobacteria bacterium]|nr:FHA domain-containing protein [Deltaproteobacteria bacterium]